MNPSKIFCLLTLLISFNLTGCSEKSSQPSDTKSIKIEITTPNEAKDDSKIKEETTGLVAIKGIRIGDPVNRLDIAFGLDTSKGWEELRSIHPALPKILKITQSGSVSHDFSPSITILKSPENKIKAIFCNLRYIGEHGRLFENGGGISEAHFAMHRSQCEGNNLRLFSPVMSQGTFSEKSIFQTYGEPISIKRVKEAPHMFLFDFFVPDEKVIELEYKNAYIYTAMDRVVGMAVLDDEVKQLIKKIDSGLIK